MALFSRSSGGAEAVYARILDGEHLWLAVVGDGPLSLRGDGVDLAVPTEERDGLLTAVVDLAPVLEPASLTLMAGTGRKAVAVRHAAPAGDAGATHDGRGEPVVEAVDGAVVVRRRAASAGVEASGFVATGAGVAFDLTTPAAAVSLVVRNQAVAELPVVDGRLVLAAVPDLPAGATATFSVAGEPVVRRRNLLQRPNYAVVMPPMLEPGVELRWLKDGRLALFRSDGATP